jgi:hypothetical protein
MNARNIEDKSMQTIEVITRIVPASDERGVAIIDLSEKGKCQMGNLQDKIRSHNRAQVWNVQPSNWTKHQVD